MQQTKQTRIYRKNTLGIEDIQINEKTLTRSEIISMKKNNERVHNLQPHKKGKPIPTLKLNRGCGKIQKSDGHNKASQQKILQNEYEAHEKTKKELKAKGIIPKPLDVQGPDSYGR